MGTQATTMRTGTFYILLLLFVVVTPRSVTETRSNKKGVCIPPGERFHCGDLEAFSRISWWYNWHVEPNHNHENWCTCESGPDCGTEPDVPEFVPMIWGYNETHAWHDDQNDPVANKYPVVLGFNEPNKEDQSDLSPEEAAYAWLEIQDMYPDKLLASPAPAGGNLNWFDPFFEICESLGCRIDFIATHDYRGHVNQVMNHLEDLYNRYGHKIWLTEFAKCCTTNVTEVEDFAREIIPRLEEADFVHRYSWYTTRYREDSVRSDGDWYLDKVNALFIEGTNELTKLGKIYNNH